MMLTFPDGNVVGWGIFSLSNYFKGMLFFLISMALFKKYKEHYFLLDIYQKGQKILELLLLF